MRKTNFTLGFRPDKLELHHPKTITVISEEEEPQVSNMNKPTKGAYQKIKLKP